MITYPLAFKSQVQLPWRQIKEITSPDEILAHPFLKSDAHNQNSTKTIGVEVLNNHYSCF